MKDFSSSFYLELYLEIFKRIPILTIDTRRLDPPYERKGRVTPVTGINPTTTIKFRIV